MVIVPRPPTALDAKASNAWISVGGRRTRGKESCEGGVMSSGMLSGMTSGMTSSNSKNEFRRIYGRGTFGWHVEMNGCENMCLQQKQTRLPSYKRRRELAV